MGNIQQCFIFFAAAPPSPFQYASKAAVKGTITAILNIRSMLPTATLV
jgi:hypothetical protein